MTIFYNLFEIARWKQEAMRGNISKKGLKKLSKSGVKKPYKDYMRGFKKGTDNIIRNSGYKKTSSIFPKDLNLSKPAQVMQTMLTKGAASYYTNPDRKIVNSQKLLKDRPIQTRHEADEARYFTKNPNDPLRKSGITFTKNARLPFLKRSFDIPMYLGTHASPYVLRNEKRNIDLITGMYPKESKKDTKLIKKVRKNSGEYDFISKLSPQQLRRIDKKVNKNDPEFYKQYGLTNRVINVDNYI